MRFRCIHKREFIIPDTIVKINKRRLTKIYKRSLQWIILITSGAGSELSAWAATAGNVEKLVHVSFIIITCRVTH